MGWLMAGLVCRTPTALAGPILLHLRRARRTRPRPPGPRLRRLVWLPPATTARRDRPPRSAPRCVRMHSPLLPQERVVREEAAEHLFCPY